MKTQKLFNIFVVFILSITFIGLIIPLKVNSKEGVPAAIDAENPTEPPPARLSTQAGQPIIIDHTTTDITAIPQYWIEEAKRTLHIAYGHTSHGSQLMTGMSGLVDFANNGGLGLSLPDNIFQWNIGGTDGALDVRDYAMGGDLGGNWVNETRDYLGTVNPDGRGSNHPEINVIIWSWCGQVNDYDQLQEMLNWYLSPMDQLEQDYPGITFVYMTGHAEGTGETGSVHISNQYIRNYAIANNKVLYDFYDIELYDPDGNYYGDKNVNDQCDYDSGSGTRNWAEDWQGSHTQGTDWYSCGCAHSRPLNCNQKAYAAWWLWARLAGWDGNQTDELQVQKTVSTAAPTNGQTITYTVVVKSLTTPSSTTANLTDEIPSDLAYIPGTLTATTGAVTDTSAPILSWSGVLSPTPVVTVTYAVAVSTSLTTPQLITNTALVAAQGANPISSTATIIVNGEKRYLPIVCK